MADKLMHIPNVNKLNNPFLRLQLVIETLKDTQLNKPTNQNPLKAPKVVKPMNKKMLL